MIFEGCHGNKGAEVQEKVCPQCGETVEIFSTDVSVECENCGFTVYNDIINCIQWCEFARECVGDTMYERLMEVAESQKGREDEEAQKSVRRWFF